MAINEQIQTGRKFRKLIDETSRLWLRISFWTKACDVEFDDGQTAETKLANITKMINDLKMSFQDGVNKIYNKLKGLEFTPATNSPDDICGAIQNIYDARYTNGYEDGIGQNIIKYFSWSADLSDRNNQSKSTTMTISDATSIIAVATNCEYSPCDTWWFYNQKSHIPAHIEVSVSGVTITTKTIGSLDAPEYYTSVTTHVLYI